MSVAAISPSNGHDTSKNNRETNRSARQTADALSGSGSEKPAAITENRDVALQRDVTSVFSSVLRQMGITRPQDADLNLVKTQAKKLVDTQAAEYPNISPDYVRQVKSRIDAAGETTISDVLSSTDHMALREDQGDGTAGEAVYRSVSGNNNPLAADVGSAGTRVTINLQDALQELQMEQAEVLRDNGKEVATVALEIRQSAQEKMMQQGPLVTYSTALPLSEQELASAIADINEKTSDKLADIKQRQQQLISGRDDLADRTENNETPQDTTEVEKQSDLPPANVIETTARRIIAEIMASMPEASPTEISEAAAPEVAKLGLNSEAEKAILDRLNSIVNAEMADEAPSDDDQRSARERAEERSVSDVANTRQEPDAVPDTENQEPTTPEKTDGGGDAEEKMAEEERLPDSPSDEDSPGDENDEEDRVLSDNEYNDELKYIEQRTSAVRNFASTAFR